MHCTSDCTTRPLASQSNGKSRPNQTRCCTDFLNNSPIPHPPYCLVGIPRDSHLLGTMPRPSRQTGGGWVCDACRASFANEGPYTKHIRSCRVSSACSAKLIRKGSDFLSGFHKRIKRPRQDWHSNVSPRSERFSGQRHAHHKQQNTQCLNSDQEIILPETQENVSH